MKKARDKEIEDVVRRMHDDLNEFEERLDKEDRKQEKANRNTKVIFSILGLAFVVWLIILIVKF